MTPEWLRELLIEMGRVAQGYTANPRHACRLLMAVPIGHMVEAGLNPSDFGGVVEVVLPDGCVGGHSPGLVNCALGVDWP